MLKFVLVAVILLAGVPAVEACPYCGSSSSIVQFSVNRPIRSRSSVRYSTVCPTCSIVHQSRAVIVAPPAPPPTIIQEAPAPADTAPPVVQYQSAPVVRYAQAIPVRHYDIDVRTHSQERHARKAAKHVRKAIYHAERS